jgi:hypothetical protein
LAGVQSQPEIVRNRLAYVGEGVAGAEIDAGLRVFAVN